MDRKFKIIAQNFLLHKEKNEKKYVIAYKLIAHKIYCTQKLLHQKKIIALKIIAQNLFFSFQLSFKICNF